MERKGSFLVSACALALCSNVGAATQMDSATTRELGVPRDFHPSVVTRLGRDSVLLLAQNADFVVLLRTNRKPKLIPLPGGFRSIGTVRIGRERWLVDCCGAQARSLTDDQHANAVLTSRRTPSISVKEMGQVAIATTVRRGAIHVVTIGRLKEETLLRVPVEASAGLILTAVAPTDVRAIERRHPYRAWRLRRGGTAEALGAATWARKEDTSLVILDVPRSKDVLGYVLGDPRTGVRHLVLDCRKSGIANSRVALAEFAILIPSPGNESELHEFAPLQGSFTRSLQLGAMCE